MIPEENELETVLKEIIAALDSGLYYIAVVMTLTLPDICAALISVDGRTNGRLYKEWYNKNVSALFVPMSSDDCYSLRCGVVHQGRMGVTNSQFGRVIFAIPNAQNNVFHRNVLNDALQLDATIFCREMIAAVRSWFESNKENENVVKNITHLVQYRSNGLAPYIVGVPIVA